MGTLKIYAMDSQTSTVLRQMMCFKELLKLHKVFIGCFRLILDYSVVILPSYGFVTL